MYLLLIMLSMIAVIKSCIPFNPLRIFICVSMVIGTFAALKLFPDLLEISPLTGNMAGYTAVGLAVSFVILLLILWGQKVFLRQRES